jgi:hypothetical protein
VSLQLTQLKQTVIETEHSQKFQESLKREYPALAHSLFRGHIPIYTLSQFCCLLMLTALTPVSNTVLHKYSDVKCDHFEGCLDVVLVHQALHLFLGPWFAAQVSHC